MAIYLRCFSKVLNTPLKVSSLANLNLGKRYSQYLIDEQRQILIQVLFSNNLTRVNYHCSASLFKRRKTAEERKSTRIIEYSPKAKGDIVDVWRNITIKELAELLNNNVNYVQDLFFNKLRGADTVISDMKLLQDAIKRSGRRMRIVGKPKNEDPEVDKDVYPRPPAPKSELKPRPPVVTVMGHVDHGKTTLLDSLRHSSIVKQEFGGITQHIGAFSVILESGARITFLDTPGHAAFTAMRERGANITDIVVLVVAADDGVMEQTTESVRMARQANVPILVAINKIDAPKADIERTKRSLVEIGIQVESFGGDVQAIPISALKHKNLDQLTEALVLQAELLEIGADPTGFVEAVVVDSKVHPYRGKLCTVVVQRGTLKKGAVLVAGTAMAKVRNIKDAEGNTLERVTPGYPAEVEGWKDLPSAGELVLEVESEKQARAALRVREDKKVQERQDEDIAAITAKEEQHQREYKEKLQIKRRLGRYRLRQEGPRKPEMQQDSDEPALNLLVKGDVDGTLEAILTTLDTYESDDCELDLVHYGVGPVTETDIELAKTFNAVIYAFNVQTPGHLETLANDSGVVIKHHNVIYKLIDDVKGEINSKLPKKEIEEIIGQATVLQHFDISEGRKKVPVAGCRCIKGLLKRSSLYRLIRNGDILHEGPLISMRHLKNEVDTIKKDIECGLQLVNRDVDFKPGDVLICYEKKMVPQETAWDPGF